MASRSITPGDLALLAQTAENYQTQLQGDDASGREYLRALGVQSRDTIETFKIGWSDGKLASRCTDEDRRRLQALGLLTHNRKERMGNSLIVPVSDPDSGNVVDLYALRRHQHVKVNLFTPPRGLLHYEALKAADEIIVTDLLEAALLIHQAGWRAVVVVRDLTDVKNNIERFQAARLKRIWICSVRYREQLFRALKPMGCELRRLKLHKKLRNITSDTLRRQMDGAESLQPSRPRPAFIQGADDGGVFEQHGVRFTLSGLKDDAGQDNLKAVITAQAKEKQHTDRVDLLSAASRKRFAKDTAAVLSADREKVEAVLLDLIDETKALLEDRRRKKDADVLAVETSAPVMLPEDRKQAALKLLRDPALADRIIEDLALLGLVGEQDNALLLFLVAVSRKLQRPLSAILRSESASGKSNLVERIIDLLPEEDVLYVSRLSGNALFYMPPGTLQHRLLVVEERDGSEESDYAVRILQSKGYLTTAIPMPPEEPGVMRTRLITVKGPVAYVETTTRRRH